MNERKYCNLYHSKNESTQFVFIEERKYGSTLCSKDFKERKHMNLLHLGKETWDHII